jgi:hypothetical protein
MARTRGSLGTVSKVKAVLDVNAARLAIARHLTSLTELHNVNMVQFRAQVHEEEAVSTLVEIMRDPEMPPALRRQCATDIVLYARGGVKVWVHDQATINAEAPGTTAGVTVGAEIEAARNTAALYEKFNLLVAQGIHSDDWPDDVRQIAGDLIDHFNKVPVVINEQ